MAVPEVSPEAPVIAASMGAANGSRKPLPERTRLLALVRELSSCNRRWLRHYEKSGEATLAPQTRWSVKHGCFGNCGCVCFQHRLQAVREDIVLKP
jgi:hypothetical protein